MIFLDSWAWIALADKSDPYHRKAKAEHKKLVRTRQQYVTTDYVLAETITYLYDALSPAQAQGFFNTLIAALDQGAYLLLSLAYLRTGCGGLLLDLQQLRGLRSQEL